MRLLLVSRLLRSATVAAAEMRLLGPTSSCRSCFISRPFSITSPSAAAASIFPDQGGKSDAGLDAAVTELDEQGREVGCTGPDPSLPRGSTWQQQTVEGAMSNDSAAPSPGEDLGGGGGRGQDSMGAPELDRRSPGGATAEELDDLRPTGQGGSSSVGAGGPGAYVAERLKEVAAGAWETFKHGVNNLGQPQVIEELKRTSPQDAEALTNPRGAATARQQRQQQDAGRSSSSGGSSNL